MIAHKDVPEEVVYDVTKTIYENLDELAEIHHSLGTLDFDYIQTFINANTPGIPWHPGALRFYEEIGIQVPDYVREENFES